MTPMPSSLLMRSAVTFIFLATMCGAIPAAAQVSNAAAQSPAPTAASTTAALTTAEPTATDESDARTGQLSLSGGVDVVNRYMFRGIRQNGTGVALWPVLDFGVTAYAGSGAIKQIQLSVGTWNSLHTGDTGRKGPSGKRWYERDFDATVGLSFGGGVSLETAYTIYTSPNDSFSTVKEVVVTLAVDDSEQRGSFKPYVTFARELDTSVGLGQADGGNQAGTYFEVGVAPGYSGSRASLAIPIKVGVSLGNYYELGGADHRFGYASAAAVLTVPLGSGSGPASKWDVHGGVEYQRLGTTTRAFNGGERVRVIGSMGIAFSY